MNSLKSAPRKNFDCGLLFDDPIVQEVRAVRHDLAAKFGNDLHQIANDLMSRQARLGHRLRTTRENDGT